MKRVRGFKIGRVFKWIIRPCKKRTRFLHRLTGSFNPFSKMMKLARKLKASKRNYIRLGKPQPAKEVPKGHLAVYVGESNGDTRREVVPVIYFNHPLFGELLKDSERVYGYHHPGGIKIPCGHSEFEKVKMRIMAWDRNHCNSNNFKHYWS